MPAAAITDQRALNRALLARQGLLDRSAVPVLDMVEQLVGMQAQVPENPYLGLWSRLAGFRPEALSGLIAERGAVRAQLMRATIHLVSARDCLALQPITLPVLARAFKSPWSGRLAGAPLDEVVVAGVELLDDEPLTRAQLSARLAPRWPDADPLALAHAVTFNAALVQIPPRGLWRASGQATWAPAKEWLGSDPGPARATDATDALDALVARYLAAFGPATVADIRTWSGLTGLREVVDRLGPRLERVRDERGRELLDVPGAPRPDPDTPAPPRFLPEYDNVALSHADRSRLFDGRGPGMPWPKGPTFGPLIVDGFYRANWKAEVEGDVATLTVEGFAASRTDPAGTADEIAAEADGLLAFLHPAANDRRVVVAATSRG